MIVLCNWYVFTSRTMCMYLSASVGLRKASVYAHACGNLVALATRSANGTVTV